MSSHNVHMLGSSRLLRKIALFAAQSMMMKYDAMVEKSTDVSGSSSNKYWKFFIPCTEEKVSLSVFFEACGKHFSTAPVPIIIKLQL